MSNMMISMGDGKACVYKTNDDIGEEDDNLFPLSTDP